MKRILFVASINPFKTGGGSQATLAYLDSVIEIFGKENLDVMIPSECDIPEDYRNINYIRVKIRKKHVKYFQYFSGILSRFTMPLIKYITKHRNDYFLCIINGGVIAGKSVRIINRYGVRTVVIHHNHEMEYHFDNKTIESLKGHCLYFIKNTEGSSFLNSDINLFLTKEDINTFHSVYGKPKGESFLIGTYEMKDARNVLINNDDKKYSFTISGTLANHQTTTGVQNFFDRYFHIAKKLVPDIKILLTGRSPSEKILKIKSDNITMVDIVANPADILSIVQLGQLYLCPINIGGGLKLRAMDGLKCNMPILIHRVSARGYDFFFDKPYFKIYDDEISFESGLKDILVYNNSKVYSNVIQDDYYKFFGFNQGTQRMKDALSVINQQNDIKLI